MTVVAGKIKHMNTDALVVSVPLFRVCVPLRTRFVPFVGFKRRLRPDFVSGSNAIAACRRLFDIAIADGHLQHNPAKAVRKPPRQEMPYTGSRCARG